MRSLPPRVTADVRRDGLREYWRERVRQHVADVYAGVPISKMPEDLRVYEHLIWAGRVDTVIEIGTQFGGSALWFRDRLRTAAAYGRAPSGIRVVSLDLAQDAARDALGRADPGYADTVELVEGDVRDPGIAAQVAGRLREGARCLVVEDSAHVYATTMAALQAFAGFVAPGGFLVVEDGIVDVEPLRAEAGWPRGVLPAVSDWLVTEGGRDFRVRRDLERYGVSCHPRGFLQRRRVVDRLRDPRRRVAPRG